MIERKIVRVYETTYQQTRGKFEPFAENNEYRRMFLSKNKNSDSEVNKINDMVDSFSLKCERDQKLRGCIQRTNYNTESFSTLANILLDVLLYQRPSLAIEATNMLYKIFSMQSEMEKVYDEAILLLDENYYKVYKLLYFHNSKLIKLTRNFSRIPSKPKKIMEFYSIFRAGNPLLDKTARKFPGLIDLCYSCLLYTSDAADE